MPQNKTLSTGILVPDFLNEAVRVNVANLELGNSQTVTVEVLNWGVDTFGWLATSDPTPMQVQPSSPVMIGPDSQQSFLVQLLGPPKPLYEVRVTIPRDQHLVITCCALDNSLRVIAGNTVWHEELVEVGEVGEVGSAIAGCCVNSIADLTALNAGAAPCLTVLGYYTPGDGGGGEFYWNASSTEPDNGGTVIVPASNPAAGRWKRLVEGPLSVKWFGAGGGGPDDGPAIQNAIKDSLTASHGSRRALYLPQTGHSPDYRIQTGITLSEGVYLVSEGAVIGEDVHVYVNSIRKRGGVLFSITGHNVQIKGLGFTRYGTPILDTDVFVIKATGDRTDPNTTYLRSIEIRECRFFDLTAQRVDNMGKTIAVTRPIYFEFVNGATVSDCVFEPSIPDGTTVACTGPGVYVHDSVDITVRNNIFRDTGWASILFAFGCSNVRVLFNDVIGTNPNARDEGGSIDFQGAGTLNQNVQIIGNYISGPVAYTGAGGVRVGGATGVLISHNIFDQVNREYPIAISPRRNPKDPGSNLPGPRNVTVTENIFRCAPLNHVAVYVTNTQPGGKPDRSKKSSGIVISNNQVCSVGDIHFAGGFWVHAQEGGIDGAHVHDNYIEAIGWRELRKGEKYAIENAGAIWMGAFSASQFPMNDGHVHNNVVLYKQDKNPGLHQIALNIGPQANRLTVRDNSFIGFYSGIMDASDSGTSLRHFNDNVVVANGGVASALNAPQTTGNLQSQTSIASTNIAAGAVFDETIVVPSAAINQTVSVSAPSDVDPKLSWNAFVSQDNTVVLRIRNNDPTNSATLSGMWAVTVHALPRIVAGDLL